MSFKDDKKNDQGIETYPDGKMYVGEFKDDKRHGQGTFTSPDGSKYVGEFKDDKMNGQGTLISSSGTKYVGEFKDGEMKGLCTLTYPNGSKYVGEYDGMQRGQGVYINWDGKILSGTWSFRGLIKEIPMEEVKNYLKNKYPQFEGFD